MLADHAHQTMLLWNNDTTPFGFIDQKVVAMFVLPDVIPSLMFNKSNSRVNICWEVSSESMRHRHSFPFEVRAQCGLIMCWHLSKWEFNNRPHADVILRRRWLTDRNSLLPLISGTKLTKLKNGSTMSQIENIMVRRSSCKTRLSLRSGSGMRVITVVCDDIQIWQCQRDRDGALIVFDELYDIDSNRTRHDSCIKSRTKEG